MLASTLTLNDRAGADKSFTLRQWLTAKDGGSVRYDPSSLGTSIPDDVLLISHETTGKGQQAIERHLMSRYMDVVEDGVTYRITVNLTVAMPKIWANDGGYFDTATDMVAELASLACGGALSATTGITSNTTLFAIMNGES